MLRRGRPPFRLMLTTGRFVNVNGPPIVSTNPLEFPPLDTKPRARIVELVWRPTRASRQPPGIRSPAPKLRQSIASVEESNVVRDTSGLVPPRCHVIVEILPSACTARLFTVSH